MLNLPTPSTVLEYNSPNSFLVRFGEHYSSTENGLVDNPYILCSVRDGKVVDSWVCVGQTNITLGESVI